MKNEIIIHTPDALAEHIEVRLDEDTVWLNRNQITTLFGRDVKTIGKHINNVFLEGELEKEVVVAKFATTTPHGAIKGKTQTIITEHYNLTLAIAYRDLNNGGFEGPSPPRTPVAEGLAGDTDPNTNF